MKKSFEVEPHILNFFQKEVEKMNKQVKIELTEKNLLEIFYLAKSNYYKTFPMVMDSIKNARLKETREKLFLFVT